MRLNATRQACLRGGVTYCCSRTTIPFPCEPLKYGTAVTCSVMVLSLIIFPSLAASHATLPCLSFSLMSFPLVGNLFALRHEPQVRHDIAWFDRDESAVGILTHRLEAEASTVRATKATIRTCSACLFCFCPGRVSIHRKRASKFHVGSAIFTLEAKARSAR